MNNFENIHRNRYSHLSSNLKRSKSIANEERDIRQIKETVT